MGDRSSQTRIYIYICACIHTRSVGALDAGISEAIEAQAKAGEQATKDISEAQVSQKNQVVDICLYEYGMGAWFVVLQRARPSLVGLCPPTLLLQNTY